jgi:hypothetical protein
LRLCWPERAERLRLLAANLSPGLGSIELGAASARSTSRLGKLEAMSLSNGSEQARLTPYNGRLERQRSHRADFHAEFFAERLHALEIRARVLEDFRFLHE